MKDHSAQPPEWVAVDWGTSHLRAWTIAANGDVVDSFTSDQGMSKLSAADYEPALLSLLQDSLSSSRTPVVICGMAGSRQGWAEAPYATVPCAPPSIDRATRVATQDPRLDVRILPGIQQRDPADVMRGEETQIAGFLSEHGDFDGVLCLPGTHTKWAHISAGEVVSFRTYMTGELFALISSGSVLRHSVQSDGWDARAFDTAVADAISRPATVAAELFTLRARGLLHGFEPASAKARLSGLLIGMELAGARPYWLGQDVRIIGATGIAEAYCAGLQSQGAAVSTVASEDITLRGLAASYAMLKELTT